MKESPILFSAPMVRAILDGSKTQTRRVVKPWWPDYPTSAPKALPADFSMLPDGTPFRATCPYGQPGDRLWVREPFCMDDDGHQEWPVYKADGIALPVRPAGCGISRWHPSIHMPRWASRITLEVTGVRVERLQAISHDDALAEGVADFAATLSDEPHLSGESPEQASRRLQWPQRQFRQLWESINGPGSWDANPFVWVIEFRRV